MRTILTCNHGKDNVSKTEEKQSLKDTTGNLKYKYHYLSLNLMHSVLQYWSTETKYSYKW